MRCRTNGSPSSASITCTRTASTRSTRRPRSRSRTVRRRSSRQTEPSSVQARDRVMTLELVVGPVRSGKLGALLGRFAAACEAGARPLLLVPAAFERDALERDACERAGALLGGEVVTLDTLVERALGGEVEVASEALERVVRRRIGLAHGPALGLRPVALASALERLARECDRAGAPAGALERAPGGDARLAPAYAAYEAALAASGHARRGRLAVRAAERLENGPAARTRAPRFAYGLGEPPPGQARPVG